MVRGCQVTGAAKFVERPPVEKQRPWARKVTSGREGSASTSASPSHKASRIGAFIALLVSGAESVSVTCAPDRS
ncbi:MAG: hypothetical protein DI591_03970 [Citromicrobium sp.]|nr:MAG: hypothetical protein DI591_03970 [Citromicrobium sp.]